MKELGNWKPNFAGRIRRITGMAFLAAFASWFLLMSICALKGSCFVVLKCKSAKGSIFKIVFF